MGFYHDLVGGYAPRLPHGGGVAFGAIDLVGAQYGGPSAAELAARNATGVVDLVPTKSRKYPLGFPTTAIAASGGTGAISAQPQIPFRGERLIIPSDFAGALLITDLKVGKNSQLAAANPLPARAFTEQGWGVDLHLDTADVAQFVTLNLTNNASAIVTFNAVINGRAVE